MALTDNEIKARRPGSKPYKVFDGGGLYLLVNPDGSRWWRLKYRFGGRERLLAFGTYPSVSLKEARVRKDVAKAQLRSGIDPSAARRAEKAARADRASGSLERVAREWFEKKSRQWDAAGAQRILRRLEMYVFPQIGGVPIKDVRPPEILHLLRRIEDKGHPETAGRVKQYLGAVFRYAMATDRAEHDPTAALKGALIVPKAKGFASITDPRRVGELMRAINGYAGSDVVRCALQLLPRVFVRPGELRAASWDEFFFPIQVTTSSQDLDAAEWVIPAERMKMKQRHVVPLSRQVQAILRELHGYTGPEGYLFPSVRCRHRIMSENTINAALRGIGYPSDQMTGHGFRHMASTLLHGRGYRTEWIERQLSHADRNSIRAAYNFADYLPERRRMMQDWANYLDDLTALQAGQTPRDRGELGLGQTSHLLSLG